MTTDYSDMPVIDCPGLHPSLSQARTPAFRHSKARRVWVALAQRDSQLAITVRDDGRGLDRRLLSLVRIASASASEACANESKNLAEKYD